MSQVLFRPVPGEFSIRAGSATPAGARSNGDGDDDNGEAEAPGSNHVHELPPAYYAVFTFAAFSHAETEAGDATALAAEAAAAAADIDVAADLGIAATNVLHATASGAPSTTTPRSTTTTFLPPPPAPAPLEHEHANFISSRKRRVVAIVRLHVIAPRLRPVLTAACSSTAVTTENSALPITLYGSVQSEAIHVVAAGQVYVPNNLLHHDNFKNEFKKN